MKISFDRPPNYDAIVKAFPHVARTHGVLFCYGNVIHNPDGVQVTPSIHAHEEVHSCRQEKFGSVEKWWDNYLTDPAFRFAEETPAHIVEYRVIYGDVADRNRRRFYLKQIAERLAGPLYGNLVNRDKATRLLKTGVSVLLAPQTGEAA